MNLLNKLSWNGVIRSRIMWTSLLLIILNSWAVSPDYIEYLETLTGISQQALNFWLGVLITILRIDTDTALGDK